MQDKMWNFVCVDKCTLSKTETWWDTCWCLIPCFNKSDPV